MHIGYQISNILESVATQESKITNALYLCHNSIFDLILSDCDINLDSYDPNNTKFLDKNMKISVWRPDNLLKPYGIQIVNHPLTYLKNNHSIHFHLNSIIFAHDTHLTSIKKEDSFLLCSNSFRTNDTLVYFQSAMSSYNCPKINKIKLEYSIPDLLNNNGSNKNGLAVFSYNKNIEKDLIDVIGSDVDQLISLPSTIDSLNNMLNKYKIVIELDPSSIINALAGIACGAVAVILDPINMLLEYKNIPNLYIVNSIPDLIKTVSLQPEFNKEETTIFNNRFRNFQNFKENISAIIKDGQRKAFVL